MTHDAVGLTSTMQSVRRTLNRKAVVDISPQCESLMEIWNTLGDYVCYCISFPTQGLWVACMICAIGSSAIYHAFFNTSRFLHDYAATTKEILDRRRKREQKFEYVRRQMDNFGRAPDSPPSISEKGSNDVPYTKAIPKEPVDRGEEESASQGTSKEAVRRGSDEPIRAQASRSNTAIPARGGSDEPIMASASRSNTAIHASASRSNTVIPEDRGSGEKPSHIRERLPTEGRRKTD